MRQLLKRDVPKGAAVTVVALALVASVVTGREEGRAPDAVVEAAVASPRPAAPEDLDLERLKRPKKDGEIPDLFAGRSWNPPPPAPAAPVVVTKSAPSAPPLPFKYLGRLADSDRLVVFLEKNQVALSTSVGEMIEADYQVDAISETAVHFVYLPLGTKQVLNISAQ